MRYCLICILFIVSLSCKKSKDTDAGPQGPAGNDSSTVKLGLDFHGWRYIGTQAKGVVNKVAFSDYNRGMMTGSNIMASTSNGGISWGGLFTGFGTIGYGLSVYDEDNIWIEGNSFDVWYRNEHDSVFYNFKSARLDTITTVPGFKGKSITGLYMIKPYRGYVLNQEGRIYKVNGSFAPAAISLEYQCSNYQAATSTTDLQFYNISALDSNNMVICGYPGVYPNTRQVLIHKKAGVYTEYDLTSKVKFRIAQVQLTDPSTVYLSDGFTAMYKFTNGTDLVKLPIVASSFCFADSKTGYACGSDFKVYKTTDGGQTWSVEFVLRNNDDFTAMYIKDKKVWGIGRDGGVVRYDP